MNHKRQNLLLLKAGDMESKTVSEYLDLIKLEFNTSEYEVAKTIGKSPSTVNQWKKENSNQKMFYYIYLGLAKKLRMDNEAFQYGFDELDEVAENE